MRSRALWEGSRCCRRHAASFPQDAPPHLVSPTEDGAAGGGVALQHAVPGLQLALQQPSMQGIGGGGAAAGLAIAGQRLEPG